MISPDIFSTLLISIMGGAITGLISVASMKNDIVWVKRIIFKHDDRIEKFDRRIANLEGTKR